VGRIVCQRPFEICTGYRGWFLLNHIEYGVVRCGVMGSRGRKNGAYPVSVGEKKGACHVVHGIYLASFTLDQDLSHSSLLWLANVSMTIPSDFSTNQLIDPVALQTMPLLDFVR
jgi:hypothetical protein